MTAQNIGKPEKESVPVGSNIERPIQEKELFAWKAPARPFKRRDREFYVTLFAIIGVVGLILFLIEGFMPVILMVAFAFLFYILSTVKPEEIGYSITNFGVRVAESGTGWENFTRFWFSKRYNDNIVIFEMIKLPGRMELVINDGDEEKIRKVVTKYLIEEKATPVFIEKTADWLASKLPGNK